jgi:hypothetical protein
MPWWKAYAAAKGKAPDASNRRVEKQCHARVPGRKNPPIKGRGVVVAHPRPSSAPREQRGGGGRKEGKKRATPVPQLKISAPRRPFHYKTQNGHFFFSPAHIGAHPQPLARVRRIAQLVPFFLLPPSVPLPLSFSVSLPCRSAVDR